MRIEAVREDRMRGGRLRRGKSTSSPPSSPDHESISEVGVDRGTERVELADRYPSELPSPLNTTATTTPCSNRETPSQKIFWNPSTSSTLRAPDSINPQSGPKAENWNTPKSSCPSNAISAAAGPPNGPLRSYMSASATPTSSHHAPYTPCSSTSSASIPGLYESSVSKKEIVPPSNNGAYLAPTASEPRGDIALLGPSGSGSAGHTPIPQTEELQYYPRNTSSSSTNQQTGTMWSARTPPTSRPTEYYRPAPPQPQPPKGSSRFDQIDSGGFYAVDNSMIVEPENLEETLDEIAELEGELSSDDEASMVEAGSGLGFSNGTKTAVSVAAATVPFEGINFAQLFSASNAHSEKLIALAKQFYPKLNEYLIRASTQTEMGLNPADGGFLSPDNGSGSDGLGLASATTDSPLDGILCKLSSMLEDCLFHMVDWVNRTEIFRVIRVEDKMQLLYSSWSEVIVIEFLQCVILNLRMEDRSDMMKSGASSPQEPSNRDLYHLVKELIEYLLPPDDETQRIRDLIARFSALSLSSHEFTCLKFLVIFNPYKHDVNLTSSLDYVREVQSELCHFLLRAARRMIRRRPPPPPVFPTFTHTASSSTMATIAASERLSHLLLHLTEVKHVAFQLETFLVARYYASCIPNESLLTEMLLTKRGGVGSGRNSVVPPQPPPPPSVSSGYGFSGGFPSSHLKRDPNGYTPLPPPPPPWRPGSGSSEALPSTSYPATPAAAPTPQYFPPTPHSVASDYQPSQPPSQDQSFFMSPAPPPPQPPSQQQPHTTSAPVI